MVGKKMLSGKQITDSTIVIQPKEDMLKVYFKPVACSLEETESSDVLNLEAARFGNSLYVEVERKEVRITPRFLSWETGKW